MVDPRWGLEKFVTQGGNGGGKEVLIGKNDLQQIGVLDMKSQLDFTPFEMK
jgi:hypothetical protein